MDASALLLAAWFGAVVLSLWDLVTHRASDVLTSLLKFVGGMLFGASAFVLLPAAAAMPFFAVVAVTSSLLVWKGLDEVVDARVRALPVETDDSEARVETRLALRDRADRLEDRSAHWLGPVLAFVFALVLAGIGVRTEDVITIISAAVVMVVPFGRLARHRVERGELDEIDRRAPPELLPGSEPGEELEALDP